MNEARYSIRGYCGDTLTYHDDWIFTVMLPSGRVYQFVTEMWWQHGFDWNMSDDGAGTNWPAVEREALSRVEDLEERGTQTLTLTPVPQNVQELRKALNEACIKMSDEELRAQMRY